MKKIQYIIIFVSFFCLSQINSGVITYLVNYTSLHAPEEIDTKVKKHFFEFQKSTEELEFSLKFSDSITEFRTSTMMSDHLSDFAKLRLRFHPPMFADYKKDSLYFYSLTESNIILTKKASSINWHLTEESKLIDDKICYKATTIKTIINRLGNKEIEIVAWYCPEIPIPFGPQNYGGLPGLIMELNDVSGLTFYIGRINLNKKINLQIPKNKTLVDYDEYMEGSTKKNILD